MSWKLEHEFKTPTPKDTRVILVRHGESTFNAEGRHQGSSDESVLTDQGRFMARQTGKFLSGLTVDALYVSSLRRAQETATEALSMMTPTVNLQDIHVVWQLREIDLPAWQGLYRKDVQARFAEDYRCWKQSPHQFSMEDPQTKQRIYPVLDLYARSQQFWQEILPRHQGQTLMVVSHSGTNRALIGTALNLAPAYYHSFGQSNCGISVLKFPQGNLQFAQLETLNWTGHLSERLSLPNADRS